MAKRIFRYTYPAKDRFAWPLATLLGLCAADYFLFTCIRADGIRDEQGLHNLPLTMFLFLSCSAVSFGAATATARMWVRKIEIDEEEIRSINWLNRVECRIPVQEITQYGRFRDVCGTSEYRIVTQQDFLTIPGNLTEFWEFVKEIERRAPSAREITLD